MTQHKEQRRKNEHDHGHEGDRDVLLSEPVLFSDNSKKQESSHEGQHYVYDQHVIVLL